MLKLACHNSKHEGKWHKQKQIHKPPHPSTHLMPGCVWIYQHIIGLEKNPTSLFSLLKTHECINEYDLLSWKHHKPWSRIEYNEPWIFTLIKGKGIGLLHCSKNRSILISKIKLAIARKRFFFRMYKLLISFEMTIIFPLPFVNIPQGISLTNLRTYGLNNPYSLTWLYSFLVFFC